MRFKWLVCGWLVSLGLAAVVHAQTSVDATNKYSWGENIGWVSFVSSGANPYKVKTAWTCDPAPAVPAWPDPATAASEAASSLHWLQFQIREPPPEPLKRPEAEGA